MGFDGFDGVELVMELEDRLAITISDRDAEKLRTPGCTVAYLAARLGVAENTALVRCRSAEAFYHSRSRVAVAFNLPVNTLRPSTPTDTLLPAITDVAGRQTAWDGLSRAMGVRLPNLRHPDRYSTLAAVVGLAVATVVFYLSMRQPPTTAWGLAALVTVVTAILFGTPTLLLAATRHRLATEVPAGYETLGKATSGLTLFNIPHAPTSSTGWTRHELWELVRDLAAKSAGCLPSKIKRDSSWPA